MKRPVFDPLQLQSALLDVQAASHAPAAALIRRQQMRLAREIMKKRRAVLRELAK